MLFTLKKAINMLAIAALIVNIFGFTTVYAVDEVSDTPTEAVVETPAPVVEEAGEVTTDESEEPSTEGESVIEESASKLAAPEIAIALPQLEVDSKCSFDPETYRTWVVTNNTSSDIDFSWAIDNTSQDGAGVAPANGTATFDTVTEGNNTVFIYIGANQVASAEGDDSQCWPEPKECGTQLVSNGSFETPVVTKPQGWDAFPSGANNIGWKSEWLNSAPMVGKPVVANLEFQNGKTAQDGDQYTELDSDWDGISSTNLDDASVRIFQYLPTVAGETYTITYYTSPLPGTDASQNKVKFSWNGFVIDTTSEDGTANSDTAWTMHTFNLTATSGMTLLEFADAGESNTFGSLLDNVTVFQICDEPCVEFDDTFVSGTQTQFNGLTASQPSNLSDETQYTGGSAAAVVADDLGFDGAWNGAAADLDIAGSGAQWVSNSAFQPSSPDTGNGLGTEDSWRLFSYTFTIPSGAENIVASQLHFTGDNSVVAFLNNVELGTANSFATVTDVNLPTLLAGTVYKLEFAVKNDAFSDEDNQSEGNYNPVGLLYRLDLSYDDCGDGGGNDDGFSVSGNVYQDDAPQNDQKDEGEQGLSGWVLNLFAYNPESEDPAGALEYTTESGGNGDYNFTGVDEGCYVLREVVQVGWTETEPNPEHQYLIAVGGADCDFNEVPILDKIVSLFINEAFAADGDVAGLNFGNFPLEQGGSGGSSSGSRPNDPDRPGQVLGDTTTTPSTPQVLGATLPVTGTPVAAILLLMATLAVVVITPKVQAIKKN